MNTFLKDIRYGFRNLKASPTYSLIAIMTLALGIGTTTAMYTLVNSVLLQPLPFEAPDELVFVSTVNKRKNQPNQGFNISLLDKVVETPSPITELSYYAFDQLTLEKGQLQKPLTVMMTRHNFLDLFRVQPVLGRWYTESDANTQVVLISHRVWQEDFNGDPDILNREVKLDNMPYRILGVMPADYSPTGHTYIDLWEPIDRLVRPVNVLARLDRSLSDTQIKQQTRAIQRLVDQENGDTESIWEIQFTPMLDRIVGDAKASLYLLLASVFAVFLIAVLNVVNLTFAQYSNRTQELAIRVSVGATRRRLLQQLLTEGLLLCSVGGLLGLLLSAWFLEWIRELMGTRLPRLYEIGLDQNTVLAVMALITFSALMTSLIPAYSIVRPSKLSDAIKHAGRKVTGDANSQRVRRTLVIGEVSVSVVLLICAGLLMRSYVQLANQPTGFDSTDIMTGHVWLADSFQPTPNRPGFWLNLRDKLAALPGVESVAATSTMPMSRTGIDYPVTYSHPNAPAVARGEEPSASVRSITDGYFSLLGIPVLQGREFDMRDTADSPKVVIVNKKLADRAWPAQNAVGNVLQLPEWMGGDHTVVGVVENVKHRGLRANAIEAFFLPVTQHHYPGMSFLIKTRSGIDSQLAMRMQQVSTEMESTAPMILIETLEDLTRNSISSEKLLLTVLGVFAAISLLLASIGVYGISDNMVSQRTNEIGIRMAIGARPNVIRRWIIRETSRPVLIGALLGVVLAFIFSRFIASVLYGVNTFDIETFVLVPLILFLVGLIATWLPARRATRIHPQQALYYE